MNGLGRARRSRWADIVVIGVGAFVIAWGVWLYPNAGPEVDEGTLWGVHAAGGALALVAVFAALKSIWLARGILLVAGITLLVGFIGAFQELTFGGFLTVLLPAIILLAMVPFIGPMPTPEEEGKRR